jgi:hypothetical protein
MKIRFKFYLILCLPWIIVNILQAQEVVTSAGGYATSASAKITWTIGEPVTETVTGASAILTQGFNQGDLIPTLIKNPDIPGLILKVYPNPTRDNLQISVGDTDLENLNYILFDMGGKVVNKNILKGIESDIPFGNLTPSTYFLKIYQKKKEIGVYKIIKK